MTYTGILQFFQILAAIITGIRKCKALLFAEIFMLIDARSKFELV